MSQRIGIMLPVMFTEKLFDEMPKPVYVQPKIEGDRLRAILPPGAAELLSSGGKQRVSIPHIKEELEISRHVWQVELDGEVYRPGMRHSEIRSRVSRTKNLHPDYKQLEYHVFDIIATGVDYHKRIDMLHTFFRDNNFEYVKLVQGALAYDIDEVQKFYQGFLKLGYEGIIIRNLHKEYTRRKCTSLLKLKPRVSDFFEIIGISLEFDIHGVSKDTFGGFTCVTPEGEVFKVGTGVTDYQRDLIWRNRDIFVGKKVKIRFQDYTKIRRVPKLLAIDKQWAVEMQRTLTKK